MSEEEQYQLSLRGFMVVIGKAMEGKIFSEREKVMDEYMSRPQFTTAVLSWCLQQGLIERGEDGQKEKTQLPRSHAAEFAGDEEED